MFRKWVKGFLSDRLRAFFKDGRTENWVPNHMGRRRLAEFLEEQLSEEIARIYLLPEMTCHKCASDIGDGSLDPMGLCIKHAHELQECHRKLRHEHERLKDGRLVLATKLDEMTAKHPETEGCYAAGPRLRESVRRLEDANRELIEQLAIGNEHIEELESQLRSSQGEPEDFEATMRRFKRLLDQLG